MKAWSALLTLIILYPISGSICYQNSHANAAESQELQQPTTAENSARGFVKNRFNELDNLLEAGAPGVEPLAAVIGGKMEVQTANKFVTDRELTGIELTVINKSNRSLVIDGTAATLLVDGTKKKCVGIAAIEKTIKAPDSARHKYIRDIGSVLTSATSIGAVQSIEDERQNRAPVRQRYGSDEVRREKERSGFGKRVLFPEQKSGGIIYFDGKIPSSKITIELTVHDLNNYKDTAQISVPINQ